MSTADNLATLKRAIERWHHNDLPGYLELYDPSVVLHGYQGVEPGLASVTAFYQAFWSAFPNSQLNLDDIISQGDQICVRFTLRATHRGPFNGLPATGKAISLPGITILRFANGKCVERWSQADFLGLLQQLGALPGPA